jgi:signal transduction histidine kinase
VLLHTVAYSCGGIRTAGTMYWGVIVLYAFMLLGKKAGQYFAVFVIVHIVYLFLISTYTNLTSFDLFKNDTALINQDFLTNAILSIFLIASQSSYMQSGRNVVIQRLTKSKEELEFKNQKLEEQNNLLNEYTHRLEKTNHELDKFVSVASHDLKAPLRAIGNLAFMIEEDAGNYLPLEARQNLTSILSRVNRMDHLMNALLEYSRIGNAKGEEGTVNVKDIIDSLPFFTMVNERAELVVKNSLPVLFNDRIKLSRVFANLVDNAIKFSDKEKIMIEISCEEIHDTYIFSVRDNGPGIDKIHHEKVFVLFQTLQRRDEFESMGVGLAITKKIIEERGGKIWVESKRGEGADFRFTIPKDSGRKPASLVA